MYENHELYLVRKIKNNIKRKQSEIKDLRDSSISAICYADDKVQSTPGDSMSDLVARILKLEDECNELIVKLGKVISEINFRLYHFVKDDDSIRILELYFLTSYSIRDCAAILNCSERTVRRRLKSAVEVWDAEFINEFEPLNAVMC